MGKALLEAGRQAAKSEPFSLFTLRGFVHRFFSPPDARHRPEGLSSDAAGVSHALSGSSTDKLTREHRMTFDEAHLILNSKKEESIEQIIKVFSIPFVYSVLAHVLWTELRAFVFCKFSTR